MPGKTRVIACATVIEEILPLLSSEISYEVLDFGLHLRPDDLKGTLQQAIERAGQEVDTVILGYGLCSMAVVGLTASDCTLVVPRVDDCIAIFLGSNSAYKQQTGQEPGTYYLTKGWIEVNDTILDEYNRAVDQFRKMQAKRIMDIMFRHYKRLVYINTGTADQRHYQVYARRVADQFSLQYEEVMGSNKLIKKMLFGPWDSDFVIASPGQTIMYADFKAAAHA